MEESAANAPLFHDVTLSYIISDDLSEHQAGILVNLVTSHGGRHVPLRSEGRDVEDLTKITHLISTHIDFPQYNAALENGIHVVTPSWITRSVDKGRQAQIRQYSPDPSQYFRHVILTCADLPEGDKDAIIAGVIALGGQYSGVLSKLVTHIVTNDVDNDKCRVAVDKHLSCKIVLPHWFDHCFQLGRMINEKPYTFPDPEFLRRDNAARVREYASAHLDGAIVASPRDIPQTLPPSSPSEARKGLNVFMSRKILLAEDLQLSDHLHKTLEELINRAGGTLTNDVSQCDVYIGQFRDGKDYVQASRRNKIVANLSWLYHIINRNRYTNPCNKLLHYPVPRKGIAGFENMRISISNYTGDARIYLENLIRHCGAEFTKTMKQDNTHLITAHTQSEKCEAAQEWNINIVNHIWLEECYAKSSVQTLSNPRYTCFPARTNLGEVTGQTSFDLKRLQQVYFSKPAGSPQNTVPTTSTALASSKPSPRKTTSSALAAKFRGAAEQDSSGPAAANEMEDEQPQTTRKPRGRPSKSAVTPAFRDDEKENESPLLHSSGRAAKMKAADRLHDQADDIALFQKEMKRKGGVIHGGRRSSLSAAQEDDSSLASIPKSRKKRTSDEATYDVTAEGSDLSDGETQVTPAKRAKKNTPTPANLPSIEYKVIVSGDDRWIHKPHKESADRLKLRQLGIQLTQDTRDVDFLVAPRILRTRKFVCAIASAPRVVGIDWLDNALNQQEFVEDPPLLQDPEMEAKWDFDLKQSLERAKVNQGKLFSGWSIFVTKDVKGGFDTYKDVVTSNGGNCFLYAGRTGLTLPRRSLRPRNDTDSDEESEVEEDAEEEEFDYVYLVSGASEQETKLWKTFRRLAEKQGLQARVVQTEWLLHAAMSQQIEWKAQWEFKEAAGGD